MIPNANRGLHVGLGVEPTVSYSSEEKVKMLISVFWVSRETFIIRSHYSFDLRGKHGKYREKKGCRLFLV